MGEDSPPSTLNFRGRGKRENPLRRMKARMRCENRMERSSVPYTKGQRERRKGSSTITLNAAALDSAIAEALKSSFDLRDSMNVGLTGLGDLIASHADEPDDANDDGDSNGSKDDDESVIEGEPPAKKSKLDEPGKNRYPLISKPTLQLIEHVGPAVDLIDGDLASLVDKIIREKANEDKETDLKKKNTKLPRIAPPCHRQRSIKVYGTIWMSQLGQLTKNSKG